MQPPVISVAMEVPPYSVAVPCNRAARINPAALSPMTRTGTSWPDGEVSIPAIALPLGGRGMAVACPRVRGLDGVPARWMIHTPSIDGILHCSYGSCLARLKRRGGAKIPTNNAIQALGFARPTWWIGWHSTEILHLSRGHHRPP